ncbi:MAG TPA: NADH-quinone oxidoreductase subunit L [Methylophilaceae bacterium]|nr:NADH-quinone oxidoreductase subunit L [Methylophilaceae bacterium]
MAVFLFQGLLPALYFSGFLLALALPRHSWPIALGTAFTAFLYSLAGFPVALFGLAEYPYEIHSASMLVAILVAGLGVVIIRFASRYLQGEPRQEIFVRAILFTLACVSLLVLSRHLMVMVVAWSAVSFGLHYLLTFYHERKTAQIVAHKKFIVSRLADLCLLGALLLIYQTTGDLTLDGLHRSLAGLASLPAPLHLAACLFALAAILKSAQLPLHGWVIQVMEAPTPVSALLHAGIVNIGGLVMIKLGELLALAPIAQALLIIVGSSTAVLAGLVMLTRISIKVRLAWSTCSQMGFMLMEVGLGLYELALLHLVAHSLYKAHAFLSTGNAVTEARMRDFMPDASAAHSISGYLFAAVMSGSVVLGVSWIGQALLPSLVLPPLAVFIMAVGLAPLLWTGPASGIADLGRNLLRVFGLSLLYLVWHGIFSGLTPAAQVSFSGWWVVVALMLGALYFMQVWLRAYPQGKLAKLIYPWAYNGFYLDESFTRLAFRLWPLQLSPAQARTQVNRHFITQEH